MCLVRLRAEETNVACRLTVSAPQVRDIIGFAVGPDHEPCDALAQICPEAAQRGKRQMMALAARDPRDRDHHQPVFRQR